MVELALYIIGCVICYFVVICAISYGIMIIGLVCEGIIKAWEKLNSFGRAVFFGTPILIAVYFLFTFIFYTAVPFYLENEIARIISYDVFGIIGYLALIPVGWNYDFRIFSVKNGGILPFVARLVFLLPYLPILYLGFYFKQVFCKLFMTGYNAKWNPHFITNEYYNNARSNYTDTINVHLKDNEVQYEKCTIAADAIAEANEIIKNYNNLAKSYKPRG